MSEETFDDLWRRVNGALRSAIDAHGPITLENHGSAGKRIAGALFENPAWVTCEPPHPALTRTTQVSCPNCSILHAPIDGNFYCPTCAGLRMDLGLENHIDEEGNQTRR